VAGAGTASQLASARAPHRRPVRPLGRHGVHPMEEPAVDLAVGFGRIVTSEIFRNRGTDYHGRSSYSGMEWMVGSRERREGGRARYLVGPVARSAARRSRVQQALDVPQHRVADLLACPGRKTPY
jgi:hypothetical protein